MVTGRGSSHPEEQDHIPHLEEMIVTKLKLTVVDGGAVLWIAPIGRWPAEDYKAFRRLGDLHHAHQVPGERTLAFAKETEHSLKIQVGKVKHWELVYVPGKEAIPLPEYMDQMKKITPRARVY